MSIQDLSLVRKSLLKLVANLHFYMTLNILEFLCLIFENVYFFLFFMYEYDSCSKIFVC